MPIGTRVRQMLGPLEPLAARMYRGFFVSLRRLARSIRQRVPAATRILEIGCGQGQLTTELARAYPDAQLTGIDITPTIGRLFEGDRSRVRFELVTVQEFAECHAGTFDLVAICDVIHHVPVQQHAAFLASALRLLKPDGHLVLKDWARMSTLIYWLGDFSDRYISGDRQVLFRSPPEMRQFIQSVCGPQSIEHEGHVAPWRTNILLFVRPQRLPALLGAATSP